MKKLIILLLITIMFGCNDNESPLQSSGVEKTSNIEWAPVFGKDATSMNKTITLTEEIDGAVGGLIRYSSSVGNNVKLDYQLQFLPGAFDGIKTITVNLDGNSFTGDYYPHGNFYKPAILSIKVTNADLSFVASEDEIKFVYISETGELEYLDYRNFRIDLAKGKLDLRNAELPHFSRYGFTR